MGERAYLRLYIRGSLVISLERMKGRRYEP